MAEKWSEGKTIPADLPVVSEPLDFSDADADGGNRGDVPPSAPKPPTNEGGDSGKK